MKTSKILLSVILATAMLFCALPLTAFAVDDDLAESGVSITVNTVYHSDTRTVDANWNSVAGAVYYEIKLLQYNPQYEDYYTLPGTTYQRVTSSEPLSCTFGDCFELYGYGTMDYRIQVDAYKDNVSGTKIASGSSAVFQTGIPILYEISSVSLSTDGVCSWTEIAGAQYYDILLYTKLQNNPKVLIGNARVHQGIGKFLFSDKMKTGQEYFITVEAKSDGYRSHPPKQSETITAANLDLPSVTGLKWNAYTLKWNAVENASTYVLSVCRYIAYQGQWYEQFESSFETSETSMRLTDVFKRTGKYGYVVRIHAQDSNNRAVTLETNAPHKVYDPISISDAYCSIVTPKAGNHPDMNPVSGYGDKFTTKLDCWYLDEGSYPVLTADDTFKAGKTYVIRVNYIPQDGYCFDENTKFSVNGFEATRIGGWICSVKFTIPTEQTGVILSGTAQSFLNNADNTMLYLSQGGMPAIATVYGNNGSYAFQKVKTGSYTLTVTKKNHTTREYHLALYDNMNLPVQICPIGDTDLNGKVNIRDVNDLYNHVKGSAIITDPYSLQCSDVYEFGSGVTIRDVNTLYNHVSGSAPLY